MSRHVHIFAADDDADDTYLLEEAFCQLGACPSLETFRSGPALLDRLRALSPQEYPDLILLDMNLSGVSSQDVLRQLKATPPVNLIPVLTLTGSSDEAALRAMIGLGTNAIVHKSAHFDDLLRIVQAIDAFWLRSAWLPMRRA